jgi:predicted GNAT family acetyltransferase
METKEFYVIRCMTYVHRIKPKGLHFTLISLDELKIQIISIYKNMRRVQKGMKEYQIKS